MRRTSSPLFALLFAGFAITCTTKNEPNSCNNDGECNAPGTRCNLEIRQCICLTDEACAETEFCNLAGVCQEKPGCTRNLDCASVEGSYCDLASGRCIPGPVFEVGSECGLGTHCPPGTICEGHVCEPACYDDGDCLLGRICHNGMCLEDASLCNDDSFCGYAERCTQQQCKRDRRGPFCRGCSPRTAQNPEPCDDSKNFCLVNRSETGGFSHYCGVDCSLGQNCPNGFECQFIAVLTEDVCTNHAQCQCDPRRIQGSCSSNSDCNGGTCVFGVCCTGTIRDDRQCVSGEGQVSGFCTCSSDLDCPRDSCDPTRGACAISGTPCSPGGNECGAIPCVGGSCQIGQNCSPLEGLSCSDILN
jgi:hypothetical protein